MFGQLWQIMNSWFVMWMEFSKLIVNIVSTPILELVNSAIDYNPNSIIGLIIESAFAIVGEYSILQLMFSVGVVYIVVFIVIKFFVGLF